MAAGLAALCALLSGVAEASGPEVWAALHDARLAASADRDPSAATAIYETVLEFLAEDDPIRGEMLYWLAREKALEGQENLALELLAEASDHPGSHDAARSLRAQLLAARHQVTELPYVATFDDGDKGPWLRGWPRGVEADLSVVEDLDPGDPVLRWSVTVSAGLDDFLALPLARGQVGPQRVRMGVYSASQDSWLRVVFLDLSGTRWTSRVIAVPADEWAIVDLDLADFIRADAPFSEERPVPTALTRLEVRDVTAFHSDVRGAHPIYFDDVTLD